MCNDYKHKKGTGGMGGSPVKFRKREGTLEDGRVIHGECCKEPKIDKGPQSNYD